MGDSDSEDEFRPRDADQIRDEHPDLEEEEEAEGEH